MIASRQQQQEQNQQGGVMSGMSASEEHSTPDENDSNVSKTMDLEQQQREEDEENEEAPTEAVEGDALLLNRLRPWETSSPMIVTGNNSYRFRTVHYWLVILGAATALLLLGILIPRFVRFPSASNNSKNNKYTPYDIYCTGPILHAVQMMNLSLDSKDFVDRPMKADPDEVMEAFHAMVPDPNSTSSADIEHVLEFLETYFDPTGSDLRQVVPPDFQDRPSRLYQSIPHNDTLREWAMELHAMWKVLGRRPAWEQYPNRHSFLPTNHMLVVPGGRFRESYYWDTYWIVQGLLASDMYDTAKGVVQNLLDFVEYYGYVPNGGRIYYLTRSQPPMLSEMVLSLYDYNKHDVDFLKTATSTLDKEYQFWMQHGQHAVKVRSTHNNNGQEEVYTLNRYISNATEPRPESYREDLETAQKAAAYQSQEIYSEIIAACETGWDFSSRWLQDSHHLETVKTSRVVPVDLNAILHRMEKNMIHFHTLLNNPNQVDMYKHAAEHRLEAMQQVLWDPSSNMWRDYWIDTNEFSPIVSASNFFPLWSESLVDPSNTTLLKNIQTSLENSGLIEKGGVLTTTTQFTGQQWDKPNAWPPIQDILIQGLLKYNVTRALGVHLMQVWVHTNWIAYQTNGHVMMEKYNAIDPGTIGGGGEYLPQIGFGWTNGLILKLLSTHASLFNDLK